MKPRSLNKTILWVAIAAALPVLASAQTKDWAGTQPTDTWGNPANWNPNGVPAIGDEVSVTGLGFSQTVTYGSGDSGAQLGSLLVSGNSGHSMELLQDANATLTTTSLTVDSDGSIFGNGVYRLTPGASLVSGDTVIGAGGIGEFYNDSAEHLSGSLVLGQQVTGDGLYLLSGPGSSSVAADLVVGDQGHGVFEQDDGGNTVNGSLILGRQANSFGGYTLYGDVNTSTLNVQGGEYVGQAGEGGFSQAGGTNTTTNLSIAQDTGSQGVYVLSGGALNVEQGNLIAGGLGSGSFAQSNSDAGSIATITQNTADAPVNQNDAWNTGNLYIGGSPTAIAPLDPSAMGSYQMSADVPGNPLQLIVAGLISIGGSQSGQFIQGGGQVIVDHSGNPDYHYFADVLIGSQGASGAYVLSSGSLTTPDTIVVGNTSTANFFEQGGGEVNTGRVLLANVSGSEGTYNINGGTLNAGATVGLDGTGTFNNVGGVHDTLGTDVVLGAGSGSGAYNMTGPASELHAGTIILGIHGSGDFNQTQGTVTANDIRVGGDWNTDPAGLGAGQYKLEAGTVTVSGGTSVGETSQGTVTQTGGTFNAGSLTLGTSGLWASGDPGAYQLNSNGTYELQGGTLNTNGTTVSLFGLGAFNQSGVSQHSVTGDLVVGAAPAVAEPLTGTVREGQYLLASGTLAVSGDTVIGAGNNGFSGPPPEPGAKGTFTHTGGSATTTGSLVVGQGGDLNGGTGLYTLSAGVLNAGETRIGGAGLAGGTGTFEQNGGTHFTDLLYIGSGTGEGTYKLSGSGVLDLTGGPNGVAYVGEGGTAHFTQQGTTWVNTNFLNVGIIAGSDAHYDLSAGFVTVNNNLGVGGNGQGTFSQTGGTVDVDGTVFVDGNSDGSTDGKYALSGAASSLTSGSMVVGGQGAGDFEQLAGSVRITSPFETFYLGSGTGSTGTYTLSAGSLEVLANQEKIGGSGTGYFNQSGGSHTLAGAMYLGDQQGGYGEYKLTGGSFNGSSIASGEWGEGKFIQSGNSSVNVANLALATQDNPVQSRGTYQLISGSLVIRENGSEHIGVNGVGLFEQSGGTNVLTGTVSLGEQAGGDGTYKMTGGSLETEALRVGDSGTGLFDQSAGTVNVSGIAVLAESSGSQGDYKLSGSGSFTAGTLDVGDSGKGSFLQTGGTAEVTGTLILAMHGPASGEASEGRYELVDGTLNTTATTVGSGGTGQFVQSGGTNTIADILRVGELAGSNGAYALSGGALGANWQIVGENGQGQFTQTGGTNTVDTTLAVGWNGNGGYQLSGAGQLSAGWESIGRYDGSVGQFDQTGGSNSVTHDLNIGGEHGAGGQGAYNLTAGGLSVGGSLIVGTQGKGSFVQEAGTQASANTLAMGLGGTSTGSTYALDGGILTTHNSFIGDGGDATFTQTAGTHTVLGTPSAEGNLFVGVQNGATGTYNQSGGDTVAPAVVLGVQAGSHGLYNLSGGSLTGGIVLGYDGQADFHQTDAAGPSSVVADNNLHLGETAGSHGAYVLDGAGSSLHVTGANQNETIGVGGVGEFTQNAGTHSVDGALSVGGQVGGKGTYQLDGGTLTANNLTVGDAGKGTFNQTGGSNTVANGLVIANSAGSEGSSYSLAGGTLTAASLAVNVGGTFNYSGGDFVVTSGSFTNDGQFNIHAAVPQGNLGVEENIVNNGTFKVTDTQVDYTGTLTNNGAYISELSTSRFTDLTVNSSGYMQGGAGDIFIVDGNFVNHSVQNVLWNTSYSEMVFTAGDHEVYLAGADRGVVWGEKNNFALGQLDLTSGANLHLLDGNAGNVGDAWYVRYLTFTTINELLAQLSGDSIIYYDKFSNPILGGLTYDFAGGGSGQLIAAYFDVPEPSTWLLMLSGSMAVLVSRRKKA